MVKDKQINLLITEESKERWEAFIEETDDVSNMSQLIRSSVDHRIGLGPGIIVEGTGDAGGSSTDSGEVLTALKRIENRIDDVENRLGAVGRESRAQSGLNLQKAIHWGLPARTEHGENFHPADVGLTVEEIAARLGADESDVQDALEPLEDAGLVHSGSVDPRHPRGPGTFYYKEE